MLDQDIPQIIMKMTEIAQRIYFKTNIFGFAFVCTLFMRYNAGRREVVGLGQ